ncbi:MAG: HipA domain-containing protein [Balneolia bacterium]|nr:HipA domain-containing protein [Balneolia bacterium]
MNHCLICTKLLNESDTAYHQSCIKRVFARNKAPLLEYSMDELSELAKNSVLQRVTVPGVQAKLSLEVKKQTERTDKFTIVGLWGQFILKPPSLSWPELPANEHCTMLMAEAAGIETVPCGLIRLGSGEMAYITRRIDRDTAGRKYAMEDMCQLTGRMTEDKYKGSHEQIAGQIKRYSANPVFDLTRFVELVLFCYLTGNADMHLKNFSLIKDPHLGWKLAPAYDLLSTRLVMSKKDDPEELALTLNGEKSNFKTDTFLTFGKSTGLSTKQLTNIIERQQGLLESYQYIIESSFLSDELKERYKQILMERFEVIG